MDSFWSAYQEYIRSYLPQWRYDPESGEVESAVLLAAAEMIEESRTRLARLPQKHELAFLRGWELTPLPADPMHAYASLTSPEGGFVGAGKELYMSGDGARLWHTAEDTQAEPARLTDQFLTGGGKVIPLCVPTLEQPTRLFDLQLEGLPGPEVRFSHPDALSSQHGCQVELTLPQASPRLLALLCGDSVSWSLVCACGDMLSLSAPERDGENLRFSLPAASGGLALHAAVPSASLPAEAIGPVFIRTQRREIPLDLAWDGDGPCTGARWLPFGEAPETWRTCCLSCQDALTLRGAQITVRFALSIREREDLLPGMEQQPEYRPVMRRLPPPPPPVRDVWADQVLWEYWNGRVWIMIPGTESDTGSFAAGEHGAALVEVQFRWPEDAAPCEEGGQSRLWLRWRIGRAENSGWLPRRCHAPEIAGLQFSALLENAPVSVSVRGQTEKSFHPLENLRLPLFQSVTPEGSCWWLSFDRPPSGPLMRLYLTLLNRVPGGQLSAWEIGSDGRERPLTLEDGTEGLSHSGVMTINDIRGQWSVRFGLRRWWLCLRDDAERLSQGRQFPRLAGMACGVARLQTDSGERCQKDEALSPLRGGTLRAVTLTKGFGGSAVEDQTALLRRARAHQHHWGRCVSAADVEELICTQLRDVLRTRCVREDDTLCVAALMRDVFCHAAAFALRKDQIRRLLEDTSVLPALGLSITVREPVFYPVSAMVWLRPAEGVPVETVRHRVCDALDRFLHPAAGHFQGQGWRIGSLPSEMEARNYLQACLPNLSIGKLLLTAAAPDGRELDCSHVEDPFALPLPGAYTVHLMKKEEESLCTR
ncbi:hypothetical protein D3Z48_02530 [Clostridiaceae bacterium]|nr:hypothetical protein [Clostridiaceae bacterium]